MAQEERTRTTSWKVAGGCCTDEGTGRRKKYQDKGENKRK